MKRILIGILFLFAVTAFGQITTKNVVPNTNNTGWIGVTNKKWQGMMSYTGKFDYLFGNAAGLSNVPAGTGAVSSVTLISSNPAALLIASNGTTGNVTNWLSVIGSVTDTNAVLVLSSNMAVALDNGVFQASTNYANSILQSATNYANTILQSATNYSDSKDILVLQSATNYANTILQSATNYTDSKIILVLQSATNYANTILQSATNYTDAQIVLVLQSATNYANTILQSATNYADSKDILILQSATNYAITILQSSTNYANTILQAATNYTITYGNGILQSATNYANSLLSVRSSWYLRSDWTNSAFTNTGYILAPTYNSATTNTAIAINATANGYLMTFITTNQTFSIISDGSIVIDFDAHRDGNAPDTLVIKPELYLFTNSVEYVEFADATPISLTTTREHYRATIILTTNVVPTYTNTQIGIKFKCVSQTGLADIMYLWTGSNAVSVVEIPTPSATLTAAGTLTTNNVLEGANISITQNGNNQITIASTGGGSGIATQDGLGTNTTLLNATNTGTLTVSNLTATSGTNLIFNAQSIGIGTNSPLAMLHIHQPPTNVWLGNTNAIAGNPILFRVSSLGLSNTFCVYSNGIVQIGSQNAGPATLQGNGGAGTIGSGSWYITGSGSALLGQVRCSGYLGMSDGAVYQLNMYPIAKHIFGIADPNTTNYNGIIFGTNTLSTNASIAVNGSPYNPTNFIMLRTKVGRYATNTFDGLPAFSIEAPVGSATPVASSNYPASLHVLGNVLVSNQVFLPAKSTTTFIAPTTNQLGPGGACFANSNGTVWIFSCDSTGTVLTNTVLFPKW